MKRTLITCCALLLTIAAYAQTPDKTIVKVLYHFVHITDTTKRDKPYTENMLLLVGKNASAYMSYDKIDQRVNTYLDRQEMRKKGFSNQEMNDMGSAANAAYKPTSATQYYFFNKENKFYTMEPLFNGYLVDDEIEKIDWKILKDTLSFSGLHCQKATAHYKGRNWIAWFAVELPFEAGPWKLHGLPGLIVEAYDDKKDVQFKFAGVEKVKDGDLATDNAHNLTADFLKMLMSTPGLDISQVMVPKERPVHEGGYEKATRKEYDRLKAESDKDPIAFRNAELNANGMGNLIAIMAANGGRASGGGRSDANGNLQPAPTIATNAPVAAKAPKDVVNNPIELPEKK